MCPTILQEMTLQRVTWDLKHYPYESYDLKVDENTAWRLLLLITIGHPLRAFAVAHISQHLERNWRSMLINCLALKNGYNCARSRKLWKHTSNTTKIWRHTLTIATTHAHSLCCWMTYYLSEKAFQIQSSHRCDCIAWGKLQSKKVYSRDSIMSKMMVCSSLQLVLGTSLCVIPGGMRIERGWWMWMLWRGYES